MRERLLRPPSGERGTLIIPGDREGTPRDAVREPDGSVWFLLGGYWHCAILADTTNAFAPEETPDA